MDNLELIIFNPEGITLQTQHFLYLACSKDSCTLLADKSDQTRFVVSKTSSKDIVAFRNFDTNKYLGLCSVQFQIETVKYEVDETCKFTATVLDGGQIALRGHNQKFLAPLKRNGTWSLAATRDELESDCKFYINYAIEPRFKISSIHWKKIPESITYSAVVHDTLCCINGNSTTHTNTLIFPSHKAVEQQTIWKQLLGCGVKCEFEPKLPDTNATIKVQYDYMSNPSSAMVPLPVNVEPVNVTVTPKKTVIVKLILQRSEVLTLPFIATIKCLSEHGRTRYELKMDGSWIGCLYKANSEEIQIGETELAIQ